MPKMVPMHTIIVGRGEERLSPKIGVPFDFTPQEVNDLLEANPDSLREPVGEVVEDYTGPDATTIVTPPKEKGKGGKTVTLSTTKPVEPATPEDDADHL